MTLTALSTDSAPAGTAAPGLRPQPQVLAALAQRLRTARCTLLVAADGTDLRALFGRDLMGLLGRRADDLDLVGGPGSGPTPPGAVERRQRAAPETAASYDRWQDLDRSGALDWRAPGGQGRVLVLLSDLGAALRQAGAQDAAERWLERLAALVRAAPGDGPSGAQAVHLLLGVDAGAEPLLELLRLHGVPVDAVTLRLLPGLTLEPGAALPEPATPLSAAPGDAWRPAAVLQSARRGLGSRAVPLATAALLLLGSVLAGGSYLRAASRTASRDAAMVAALGQALPTLPAPATDGAVLQRWTLILGGIPGGVPSGVPGAGGGALFARELAERVAAPAGIALRIAAAPGLESDAAAPAHQRGLAAAAGDATAVAAAARIAPAGYAPPESAQAGPMRHGDAGAAAGSESTLLLARHDALLAAQRGTASARPLLLTQLYTEPVLLVVRADSPLRHLHEVRGQRVQAAAAGSADALTAAAVLRALFGDAMPALQHAAGPVDPAAWADPAGPAAVAGTAGMAGAAAAPLAGAAAALPRRTDEVSVLVGRPGRPWSEAWSVGRPDALPVGYRALTLASDHPASARALRQFLPARGPDGALTLAVMSFLAVPAQADPARQAAQDQALVRLAESLCRQLSALQRDGDSGWRGWRPGQLQVPGWPVVEAAVPVWQRCARPSAAAAT